MRSTLGMIISRRRQQTHVREPTNRLNLHRVDGVVIGIRFGQRIGRDAIPWGGLCLLYFCGPAMRVATRPVYTRGAVVDILRDVAIWADRLRFL